MASNWWKGVYDWFISASSGCIGRFIIFILASVGFGYAGVKYIGSIDTELLSSIVSTISIIAYAITGIGLFGLFIYFPLILEWLCIRRESMIKEKQLEKEIQELKLETARLNNQLTNEKDRSH